MSLVLDKTPTNTRERIKSKIYRTIRDYKRYKLRKKIALSGPCKEPTQRSFFVHMLLCKRDLLMGMCAAKSFNLASECFFKYIFHDDGSLSKKDFNLLIKHFPGCEIIPYEKSLKSAEAVLGKDSIVFRYRRKGVMMLKLIDIKLFDSNQRTILLDSDILFFKNPTELLELAHNPNAPNAFNKDIDTAYMIEKKELEEVAGVEISEKLNAGLSSISPSIIDFNLIGKWLTEIEKKHPQFIMHRIEQSLVGMLTAKSKNKTIHLPEPYDVAFFKDVKNSICKHYVGRIRHGFELEGLIYLIKELNFNKRWKTFISSKNISFLKSPISSNKE